MCNLQWNGISLVEGSSRIERQAEAGEAGSGGMQTMEHKDFERGLRALSSLGGRRHGREGVAVYSKRMIDVRDVLPCDKNGLRAEFLP